jgi:hypothetical protein
MTADNITEDLVEAIAWEIAEIQAELHQLQEDIHDSEITPDKAAETLADIVATIARLGELYATPTNSNQ